MHFDLTKFEQVAKFVAPLVLPIFGVPSAVTNLVVNGITIAQAATADGPKTNEEQKAIAMSAVQQGLEAVNIAHPGTVNVAEVMDATSDGIDATVKAIKAAKDIPVHVPTAAPPTVQ